MKLVISKLCPSHLLKTLAKSENTRSKYNYSSTNILLIVILMALEKSISINIVYEKVVNGIMKSRKRLTMTCLTITIRVSLNYIRHKMLRCVFKHL